MKTQPPKTTVPAAAKPADGWFAALSRTRWVYLCVSILLLVPVYWQPRIQAGDLSSHIYNSWLARFIESGRAEGLVLVRQTTNVLFDLMLSGLFSLFGPEAAQRIAVSLSVLIFIWGAFAFVSAAAGRRPWHLMPSIAMLAYGWVFHMGFFNFYLSMGLCLWALALVWDFSARRLAAAIPILALAYVAHGLAVAWAIILMIYLVLARRFAPRVRLYMTGGSFALIAVLRVVMSWTMLTRWSFRQITLTSGADQVWVFDTKYYAILVCLLMVWSLLFLGLIRRSGVRDVASSIPFQLCVLSAAGVFLLPTTVLIPGFSHTLTFIAERMSLGVGICVCALLGGSLPRTFEKYALIAVALVFFSFLFRDERALNSFEDRMQDTVAQIPAGQRVISALTDPDLRVNALTHMIDRACIGRCFSYANYEPSTAQFRVRAVASNPYVAATYQQSWELQVGTYVVREADLPLYEIDLDERLGQLTIKSLRSGAPCGSHDLRVLPDIL
jgi:hypothetical protein